MLLAPDMTCTRNKIKMLPTWRQYRGRHTEFGGLRHEGFGDYNTTYKAEPLNSQLVPVFLNADLSSSWKERMLWYRKAELRMGVFISCGCCEQLPQTRWLKVTGACCFHVLEARVRNPDIKGGLVPFGGHRGRVPGSCLSLGYSEGQQFFTLLGLLLPKSSLCICLHMVFPSACLCLLLFCLLWGHSSFNLGLNLIQDDLVWGSVP